jgi:hypothetical protein
MASEQLVTALVGDNRFKREIVNVRIALKRLRKDGKDILCLRGRLAILGSPRLAVEVTVLDSADESQFSRDSSKSLASCALFRGSQTGWHRSGHDDIVRSPEPRAEERLVLSSQRRSYKFLALNQRALKSVQVKATEYE